jgi:undecaprenyl diphosphate synthase
MSICAQTDPLDPSGDSAASFVYPTRLGQSSYIQNVVIGLPEMAQRYGSSKKRLTEKQLLSLIHKDRLPRHVAIIMDGNGRWAEIRGLPRIAGHREGIQSVRDVVTTSRELGIYALTIYAFSLENWQRPHEEIKELMTLLQLYLKKELPTLMKHGIRFRTIGRIKRLPKTVIRQIEEAESATQNNDQMVLTIALSYGGRSEIIDAVRKILDDCRLGILNPEKVDETCMNHYLSTAGLPDPDLMIRTSGEARISNFLLWQMAYTELYFTKTLWPNFRSRDFLQALLDYQHRERRFGLVQQQNGKQSRVGRG